MKYTDPTHVSGCGTKAPRTGLALAACPSNRELGTAKNLAWPRPSQIWAGDAKGSGRLRFPKGEWRTRRFPSAPEDRAAPLQRPWVPPCTARHQALGCVERTGVNAGPSPSLAQGYLLTSRTLQHLARKGSAWPADWGRRIC